MVTQRIMEWTGRNGNHIHVFIEDLFGCARARALIDGALQEDGLIIFYEPYTEGENKGFVAHIGRVGITADRLGELDKMLVATQKELDQDEESQRRANAFLAEAAAFYGVSRKTVNDNYVSYACLWVNAIKELEGIPVPNSIPDGETRN